MDSTKARASLLPLALSAIVAVLMSLALAPSAFALPGTPVSNAFANYKIEAYSVGATPAEKNINQHVKITLKDATLENATAAVASITGENPTCTLTIAGRSITSSNYSRPVTVSSTSDGVVVDIDHVYDGTDTPFTAQYSGVIVFEGVLSGVKNSAGVDYYVDIDSVIPTGFQLDVSGEGTNQLTLKVDEDCYAKVRGMVHLAIYDLNGDTYTPIATSAGTIEAFTFTIHAHAFSTMVDTDYLTAISNLSLPSGYAVSSVATPDEGSAYVTITGPSGTNLYMGVYDDDLLQQMGWEFSGRNTGTGEWGIGGNPDA